MNKEQILEQENKRIRELLSRTLEVLSCPTMDIFNPATIKERNELKADIQQIIKQ